MLGDIKNRDHKLFCFILISFYYKLSLMRWTVNLLRHVFQSDCERAEISNSWHVFNWQYPWTSQQPFPCLRLPRLPNSDSSPRVYMITNWGNRNKVEERRGGSVGASSSKNCGNSKIWRVMLRCIEKCGLETRASPRPPPQNEWRKNM